MNEMPVVDARERAHLPRVLGLHTLVALIVGIAVSQVGLVGVLQGIGLIGGESLPIIVGAFVTAVILAITYAASFSELSLMMPSSGGLSRYTEIAMGHFPALLATFSGYVVVNMFGLSAELLLFDNIVREVFDLDIPHSMVALMLLGALAVLNIRGTDVFAVLQNSSTAIKVAIMIASGAAVIWVQPGFWATAHQKGVEAGAFPGDIFPTGVALFFWCFVAAEFVCPMMKETKAPERNIPRSMVVGIIMLAALYGCYAFGAVHFLSRETLVDSPFPHLEYAKAVFGRAGSMVLMVFATAATIGLINGVLAGVSRMLYGMAHDGQAFRFLGKLHPTYGTPWVDIIFMAFICGAPLVLLGDEPATIMTLVVSASTSWLLAYIVAHLDVIILRIRYPMAARPFRTPFFPVLPMLGIGGMGYVIIHNPVSVLIMTGLVLGVVGLISAIWVRLVMKRPLLAPKPWSGRVGAQE
ncbi:APC family permease [Thauera sp.]|uniref:APC family permease n=1 Tax=Thauera sp. TaxID=1905334 RepID=UPI001B623A20|nr:APC family permease [Thauera sp.]MBP6133223.1 APC family permease [Thauera sp.]MBP7048610.1 APC family permease [Thauera sp.]